MPLSVIKGNSFSDCNFYTGLRDLTIFSMYKSANAYIQSYGHICEAFGIEWTASLYQNNSFTVSAFSIDA